MIATIMQPHFLGWLGLYDMIDQSDIFVFYDDVQFEKQSWQTRNYIKTSSGKLMLVLPTISKLGMKINEIQFDNKKNWKYKILQSIKQNYSKTEFYNNPKDYSYLINLISYETNSLSNYNIQLISGIARKIGIKTKFVKSSDLYSKDGAKDKRLVKIIKEIECDTYLSAYSGMNYIEKEKPGGEFPENKINLLYHNYKHPIYKQLYENKNGFISHMSIIDLIFNVGYDKCLETIRSGRGKNYNYMEVRKCMEVYK